MQAAIDVLEEQGRRAGLFPAVISGILDQLTVNTSYNPLQCAQVNVKPNRRRKTKKELMVQKGRTMYSIIFSAERGAATHFTLSIILKNGLFEHVILEMPAALAL
ncbi:hypothetical protein KIN20_029005 [Parelaphostrongylus tenuis]|uniref:Uncharacterized protein n=1 Tax=Parelaphostrongylus tenuis TaxID=148309 RepID=A0AAD5R1M7_PARTN|nr:hypothetical protein KIN20_029005 [Parelaphostrongylus tenuis]